MEITLGINTHTHTRIDCDLAFCSRLDHGYSYTGLYTSNVLMVISQTSFTAHGIRNVWKTTQKHGPKHENWIFFFKNQKRTFGVCSIYGLPIQFGRTEIHRNVKRAGMCVRTKNKAKSKMRLKIKIIIIIYCLESHRLRLKYKMHA